MRKRYNAKYNDMELEFNPFADSSPVDNSGIVIPIFKITTGLLLALWAAGLGYFVLYPLIPSGQEIKMRLQEYSIYDIGYSTATQLFVALSPPDYSLEEYGEEGENAVLSASSDRQSIEYVDPETVVLADLEKKDTRLVVESATIEGSVVDGYSQESMLDGFWHYPGSSVPGKRGNMVIFGHRFHRLPPDKQTFFNLDEIKVGDKVRIEQKDDEFTYTVVDVRVADKYDESVLASSGDYRLTLITCTPLWTSEKRLVITAIQDRLSSVI